MVCESCLARLHRSCWIESGCCAACRARVFLSRESSDEALPVPRGLGEPDEELRCLLAPELGSRERLLWAGRPMQGLMLRSKDALAIPFSILWGGFAIVWEGIALSSDAPLFFKLWGIPFVLVGLFMMVGRFFYDASVRRDTIYGITNLRVIVLTQFPFRRTRSHQFHALTTLTLATPSDGTGTLNIGLPSLTDWLSGNNFSAFQGADERVLFERIPDARAVLTLIERLGKRR